jgi:SAM-dependent methyltransferase
VPCKVCGAPAPVAFHRTQDDGPLLEAKTMRPGYERRYYQCPDCGLLFHKGFDKIEYDQLSNSKVPGAGGPVVAQVNRALRECHMLYALMGMHNLSMDSRILVFGCGTGLSFNMLLQHGRNVWATDLNMRFDLGAETLPKVLFKTELLPRMESRFLTPGQDGKECFDVITLTEVFEHFLDPVEEMRRLAGMVRPGGLIIGTTGWLDQVEESLRDWWYVQCLTHATFLSSQAFGRICAEIGCLGTLLPGSPGLIGKSTMSDTQAVFLIQKL